LRPPNLARVSHTDFRFGERAARAVRGPGLSCPGRASRHRGLQGAGPDEKDAAPHRLHRPRHRRAGEPRRFPGAAEPRARALIQQHLGALLTAAAETEELTLLASGAPGADILAHEVARELGLAQRLCLPMPADDVSCIAFDGVDPWHTRFLAIADELRDGKTLQMADHAELPRWLKGRNIDVWGRGNRWVLKLAETWGARRVTVLALWDCEDSGRDGGTAQMVRLARGVGSFNFRHIDSRELLG
jgi:hypothetical protein